MFFFKRFTKNHKDLFKFIKPDHLHPHDKLMAKTFLKLVPKSITPNQVTFLRVIMTPIVFYFIYKVNYDIGIILFLVAAFTDVIDGSLARTRNKITKFGMLFDPLADKFLIFSMILILVFKYLPWYVGVGVLFVEIIFIIAAAIAKIKFKTIKMANLWGKIKMLLQVLAISVILLALVFEEPTYLSLATGLMGLSIGFAVMSLFSHGV